MKKEEIIKKLLEPYEEELTNIANNLCLNMEGFEERLLKNLKK